MGQQQQQQQTMVEKAGGALRRIILVLTVAALMVLASAVPALAAPGRSGPNSFEPLFDKGGTEELANFGRCQSTSAKKQGPASDTKNGNPSLNDGDFGVCFP